MDFWVWTLPLSFAGLLIDSRMVWYGFIRICCGWIVFIFPAHHKNYPIHCLCTAMCVCEVNSACLIASIAANGLGTNYVCTKAIKIPFSVVLGFCLFLTVFMLMFSICCSHIRLLRPYFIITFHHFLVSFSIFKHLESRTIHSMTKKVSISIPNWGQINDTMNPYHFSITFVVVIQIYSIWSFLFKQINPAWFFNYTLWFKVNEKLKMTYFTHYYWDSNSTNHISADLYEINT